MKETLNIKEYEILNKWSGQIIETADGLPFIGKSLFNKNVLLSTGYAGNGITFSLISSMINTDIILNKPNNWVETFSLKRLKDSSNIIKRIASFIGSMIQTPKNKNSSESIELLQNDSGTVLQERNEAVAVYKDNESNLHKLSAKCTHLGCTVNWNNTEKSWDCPCHGSRFNKNGQVINGPAKTPLKIIE